jgi:hypothetical protein
MVHGNRSLEKPWSKHALAPFRYRSGVPPGIHWVWAESNRGNGAAAQGQTQLAFKLLKIGKFLLYVSQLFLRFALYRRARLQAASSQIQQTSNLAELKSQTLYATYETQCFQVAFNVLAEAAFRPWGPPQSCIPLIEANRINAEPNLPCGDANFAWPCLLSE